MFGLEQVKVIEQQYFPYYLIISSPLSPKLSLPVSEWDVGYGVECSMKLERFQRNKELVGEKFLG